MLNLNRIKAISLDLDDTLWPIWPTIARAESVLYDWLALNAPQTSTLYASPQALRAVRDALAQQRPDLAHDMTSLRRESLRFALNNAGDDPQLAEPAFEVFIAERHNVTFYPDALPALEFLAARYPLVSLSNGNAEVSRMALAPLFAGTQLQPAGNAPSFPSWQPVRSIDQVLLTKALTVTRYEVLTLRVSDHLPIAVEVRLPDACAFDAQHAAHDAA